MSNRELQSDCPYKVTVGDEHRGGKERSRVVGGKERKKMEKENRGVKG